ncbi:alpha/beta hydrolase [Rhizobium sp. BG4]|nr:alpha/beta hydrolase [Rhizobium sp. BG4]
MRDRLISQARAMRTAVLALALLPALAGLAIAADVPPQSAKSKTEVETLGSRWTKHFSEAATPEKRAAAFRSFMADNPEPTRVQIRHMDADGVEADLIWPARLHHPLGRRGILYVHGGGFHGGSPRTHRLLAGSLAKAASSDVLLIDYRLVPEGRYPAQIDDIRTAYRWMLENGYESGNIVVAGDGTGANLALEAVLRQKAAGRQLPAAFVAISPVSDLSASGASMQANAATDPVISKAVIDAFAKPYLGATAPQDPAVSPLFADLSGLPPMLLQVSGSEALLDDSLRLADKARQAGVDVTLEVWPGLIHGWQLFPHLLEDADKSNQRIAEFAMRHFADSPQQ